jgi:rsbT co-antagonist protein RsbR
LRAVVAESSRRGAREGVAPAETAHGVLALREAFNQAAQSEQTDMSAYIEAVIASARLVDALALLTFETYVQSREQVIRAQGAQLTELSTPVVQLWDGIVAVPLVGTLDSGRAQVVMEALLQAIVDEHAQVAILDITGVPTFDTLVAQNLLKTVTATRLMGADCIISGIRPQTAQTIVQLGIDLTEITTRASLADALKTAIRRVDPKAAASAPAPEA